MKLFQLLCIYFFITLFLSANSGISKEDIKRYRILRSLILGQTIRLVLISKDLTTPAISDGTIGRKDPWMNGIFRSSK